MIHIIEQQAGVITGQNGKQVFSHHAACGQPVYAFSAFKPKQQIRVGQPPHTMCSACLAVMAKNANRAVVDEGVISEEIKDPVAGKPLTTDKEMGFGVFRSVVTKEEDQDEVQKGRAFSDDGLGALQELPFG